VASEPGSSVDGPGRGLDVNRFPTVATAAEETDDGAALSSPNSTVSSFQMDFCVRNGGRNKRDLEVETERASSRASDDEENGSTRKKLRLSKEQSAFLEESFKEHSTLNPVSPTFKDLKNQFLFLFCLLQICSLNLFFIPQCAEAKACFGKTVKPSSSAGGSVVSEQKSKVFFSFLFLLKKKILIILCLFFFFFWS
jgi:hypothetical protein